MKYHNLIKQKNILLIARLGYVDILRVEFWRKKDSNVVICQAVIRRIKQLRGFDMNVSYVHGLIGGMLVGVAAVVLYWINGRIMGVSGIASKLLAKLNQDYWWRL